MFRLKNLISALLNMAICSAAQITQDISNVEYHVKIRKIDEENVNGVFVYSEYTQEKKYFEIETKFLQTNEDNTKTEVTLENAIFEIQKVGGVSPFSIFTTVVHKSFETSKKLR